MVTAVILWGWNYINVYTDGAVAAAEALGSWSPGLWPLSDEGLQ